MPSLQERFENLEQDLLAKPMSIALMSNLPFAILRYEPDKDGEREWELRKRTRLLKHKLEAHGFRVHLLSMADFWRRAIEMTEGLQALVNLEKERGFDAAQRQINLLLSDPDFAPLPDLLAERMAGLDPHRDIIFLMRLGVFTPSIYQTSKLLEEMMGRTAVPTIMFYPGGLEGHTGLRFMNIEGRDALGNYRVKIYG